MNTTGHAWVLDGECGEYYHINWGWYGYSDGYFKKGTFSTTDRYSVDSVIDTETRQVQARNYTWNYRLVTYGDWN
ncbi:MAG: C10 family peptidase [Bacteroidales bacterium]|nr:C10 family peptidase [Bacteroidales bacterium]